jgi:hypothetical protein
MDFNPTTILANARAADTDDLLDRVTAYRDGMEPEAIDLIEMELRRRGVTADEIERHGEQYRDCLRDQAGNVLMCSWCRKPAVSEEWGWHRIWNLVPAFPRRYRYCAEHRPVEEPGPDDDNGDNQ